MDRFSTKFNIFEAPFRIEKKNPYQSYYHWIDKDFFLALQNLRIDLTELGKLRFDFPYEMNLSRVSRTYICKLMGIVQSNHDRILQ